MDLLAWLQDHWIATVSAIATTVTAWAKRRKLSSTGSGFWHWLGEQREIRTKLGSTQVLLEICGQENVMMQAALERLTGTALALKEAKDLGLIHVSPDSSPWPTSSPPSLPALPPDRAPE